VGTHKKGKREGGKVLFLETKDETGMRPQKGVDLTGRQFMKNKPPLRLSPATVGNHQQERREGGGKKREEGRNRQPQPYFHQY